MFFDGNRGRAGTSSWASKAGPFMRPLLPSSPGPISRPRELEGSSERQCRRCTMLIVVSEKRGTKLSIALDMQGTMYSKPINSQLRVHLADLPGRTFEQNRILVFLVGRGSVKLDLNLGCSLGFLGVKRHLAACRSRLTTNGKLGSNKELYEWPAEADLQAKSLPRPEAHTGPVMTSSRLGNIFRIVSQPVPSEQVVHWLRAEAPGGSLSCSDGDADL